MATINFKVSTWETLVIPNNELEKLIELVNEGYIEESFDVEANGITIESWIDNPESLTQIDPEENNGMPTIVVEADNFTRLWDNSDNFELSEEASKLLKQCMRDSAKDESSLD